MLTGAGVPCIVACVSPETQAGGHFTALPPGLFDNALANPPTGGTSAFNKILEAFPVAGIGAFWSANKRTTQVMLIALRDFATDLAQPDGNGLGGAPCHDLGAVVNDPNHTALGRRLVCFICYAAYVEGWHSRNQIAYCTSTRLPAMVRLPGEQTGLALSRQLRGMPANDQCRQQQQQQQQQQPQQQPQQQQQQPQQQHQQPQQQQPQQLQQAGGQQPQAGAQQQQQAAAQQSQAGGQQQQQAGGQPQQNGACRRATVPDDQRHLVLAHQHQRGRQSNTHGTLGQTVRHLAEDIVFMSRSTATLVSAIQAMVPIAENFLPPVDSITKMIHPDDGAASFLVANMRSRGFFVNPSAASDQPRAFLRLVEEAYPLLEPQLKNLRDKLTAETADRKCRPTAVARPTQPTKSSERWAAPACSRTSGRPVSSSRPPKCGTREPAPVMRRRGSAALHLSAAQRHLSASRHSEATHRLTTGPPPRSHESLQLRRSAGRRPNWFGKPWPRTPSTTSPARSRPY